MRGHLTAAAVLCVVATSAQAAQGVLLAPDRLPVEWRNRVASEITQAKRATPGAFRAVAKVRQSVAAFDAKKRGRLAPVSPYFKAIGPKAALPLIEAIAFDSPPRGELSDSAWLALRVGLVEGLANLRNARAPAIFTALLSEPGLEPPVIRAAAEGLGLWGDDDAVSTLVEASREPGPRRVSILSGMGSCRRLVAARALADVLSKHPDESIAREVAKALGEVGSAWAWKTPGVAHREEEAPVRTVAAEALVSAFVAYDGEVRQAASNSLLLVDAPGSPALVARARADASPEVAAALDQLGHRLEKNPIR